MGLVQETIRVTGAKPVAERLTTFMTLVTKLAESIIADAWAKTWPQVERLPMDRQPSRDELIHRALRQGVRL